MAARTDSIRSRRDRRLRREVAGRRASISIVALRFRQAAAPLATTDREILLPRDGRVSQLPKMKSSKMTKARTIRGTGPSQLSNKATHLTSIAMANNRPISSQTTDLSKILQLLQLAGTLSCSKKQACASTGSSVRKPTEIRIDRHMTAMVAPTLMKMCR